MQRSSLDDSRSSRPHPNYHGTNSTDENFATNERDSYALDRAPPAQRANLALGNPSHSLSHDFPDKLSFHGVQGALRRYHVDQFSDRHDEPQTLRQNIPDHVLPRSVGVIRQQTPPSRRQLPPPFNDGHINWSTRISKDNNSPIPLSPNPTAPDGNGGWSVKLPPITMARLEPVSTLTVRILKDENGNAMKGRDGIPLRDFPFLPRHIAANPSPLLLEHWFRCSPAIKFDDIWMRMPEERTSLTRNDRNKLAIERQKIRSLFNCRYSPSKSPSFSFLAPQRPSYADSQQYSNFSYDKLSHPTRYEAELVDSLTQEQIDLNIGWAVGPNGLINPQNPKHVIPLDFW